MTDQSKIRDQIAEFGKRMFQRGYVAANDGNISVRTGDRRMIITPTGVSKGYMVPAEMAILDFDGCLVDGPKRASSEWKMHATIFEGRPDVNAIVHAHPPYATGFSVAGIPLDKEVLAEVVISLGSIPLAEFQLPSSEELAQVVGEAMLRNDAALLANHGAVTVGPNLEKAYFRMETLEHYAHIRWIARSLGRENALTPEQVEALTKLRTDYQPGATPVCDICPNKAAAESVTRRQLNDRELIELITEVTYTIIEELKTRAETI